jgi:diguanylate cyclase (GGDEF)-like protein/PAS domain S-box-containing protein
MNTTRVLVVEDERIIAEDIYRTLRRLGYQPLGPLSSGEAAIEQLATLSPQLILMDISLRGDLDGISTSQHIRANYDIPIIFLTAYSDSATVRRAQNTLPYGYLIKPFEERELYVAIETAMYRHAVEAKLQRVERWLSATLTSIGDAVIATNLDGTITFLNPVAEKLTGWTSEEAVGLAIDQVFKLYDSAGMRLASPVSQALQQGMLAGLPEGTMLHTRAGSRLAVDDNVAPIRDHKGDISGVVVVFRDTTLQRQTQAQLEFAAFHDALTGLANRASLMNRLAQVLIHYQRHPEARFAVLCLDLDHFKLVNDSFGHLVGDQLLIAVAHRLESCVRSGDTVTRIGGDEFVILLDHIADEESAVRVVDRIHEALEKPIVLDERTLFTRTSIGIAFGASHYHEPSAILRDADAALYQAKAIGRGSYAIFDAALHARVRNQLQLETDLRWAFERNEFKLFYQPIINLASGQLRGFEALLRWEHPQRGLLAATEFFETLEDIGLSVPIGHWTIRSACAQLASMHQRMPQFPDLSMSVNLSDHQLRDPALKPLVVTTLNEYELRPAWLRLEITERVVLNQQAAAIVQELAELGVQLAIDDFGTGHSALHVLHQYKLTALKIDRSFMVDMHQKRQQDMLYTIMLLANRLSLHIVAEGVETEQQRTLLAELGCAEGQGYWFASPMSAEELEHYLHTAS